MTKVVSGLNINVFENTLKNTVNSVPTKTQASFLSNQDSLSLSGKKNNDITKTNDFKTVFPNFSDLDQDKQTKVLEKLNVYLKKYPNFLNMLAKIDNPKYGDGFQFFFVPEKVDPKSTSGTAIINKAMGTSASGIIFGGSAGVLQNSLLKTPVAKISQAVVNNGIFGYKLDNAKASLDVGGMFVSSSEDTFAHEMAHVVHGYFMTNNERLELWSIYAETKKSGEFITDYSKTNHMEFFSEGVEAYLKKDISGNFPEREELKNKNPKLYKFVAKKIDENVKASETKSTFKLAGILTGYIAEESYSKGIGMVNNTYNKTKKLLGL